MPARREPRQSGQPLWRFFLARLAANLCSPWPTVLPFLPLAALGCVVFLMSQRRVVDGAAVGLTVLLVCVRVLSGVRHDA